MLSSEIFCANGECILKGTEGAVCDPAQGCAGASETSHKSEEVIEQVLGLGTVE